MFVFARILTLYAMIFWWLPDYVYMLYDMFTSDAWYLAILEDAESGVLDLRVSWLNYWISWLMHVILSLIGPCILLSFINRLPDDIFDFYSEENPCTMKNFLYYGFYGLFLWAEHLSGSTSVYIAGGKNVMHEWITKDLLPEDQQELKEFAYFEDATVKLRDLPWVDNKECPICLELYKPEDLVMQLKCGDTHVFHRKCIDEMATKNSSIKNKCPLCRKTIVSEQR